MSLHYSSVGSYRFFRAVGETVAVPTDGGSPDEGFVVLNFLKGTWTSVQAAFFASAEHNF